MNSQTPTQLVDAIVIKQVAYGDADLIVTLLTRSFGKVAGIARSAKKSQKRFAGGFDPGNRLRVMLSEKGGRDLVTIMESRLEHRPVVTSLAHVAAIGIGIEMMDQLMPIRQVDEEKFDAATLFLNQLDAHLPSPGVLVRFGLRLLSLAGFEPVLERCVECHEEEIPQAIFSTRESGVKCPRCSVDQEGISLSHEERYGLKEAMMGIVDVIENVHVVQKGGRLIREYLASILHRQLQSDSYWAMLGDWS